MTSEELQNRIIEGIESCLTGERYKQYLNVMSKFHNYSFYNCLCIALQKPEATLVAGYKSWQTKFNRHVKEGENAIYIFAPLRKRKHSDDEDDEDPQYILTGFRPVAVFDISQTEGESLPTLADELKAIVDDFSQILNKLLQISSVPVIFSREPMRGFGYYSSLSNTIVLKEGLSQLQQIKTLIHEIAHSRLHKEDADTPRDIKEIEAESVAYVVCLHLGLDTSSYSFEYLTAWSDGDTNKIKASFKRIHETANLLIKEYKECLS